MKKFLLLFSLILILGTSCNGNGDQEKDLEKAEEREREKIISDHDPLEEAKAIARKLMEGMAKVERNELARVEFERTSRPLQKKLNVLIMALEKDELKELEEYRKKLLAEQVEGK